MNDIAAAKYINYRREFQKIINNRREHEEMALKIFKRSPKHFTPSDLAEMGFENGNLSEDLKAAINCCRNIPEAFMISAIAGAVVRWFKKKPRIGRESFMDKLIERQAITPLEFAFLSTAKIQMIAEENDSPKLSQNNSFFIQNQSKSIDS